MYSYKSNSAVKNSILAFVKNLVTKKIYAAIKILLNPCCTPVILEADATCGEEEGEIILTIKFDKNITTFGDAVTSFYAYIDPFNLYISSNSVDITNGVATFSFSDVYGVTVPVVLEIFMPTNSEGTIGVSATSQPVSVTIPTEGACARG